MRWIVLGATAAVALALALIASRPASACSIVCSRYETWNLELVTVEVLDGSDTDAPEWGGTGRLHHYDYGSASLTVGVDELWLVPIPTASDTGGDSGTDTDTDGAS